MMSRTTSHIVEDETMTESDTRKSFLISNLLSADTSLETEDDEEETISVNDISMEETIQNDSKLHRAFPKPTSTSTIFPRLMSTNDFSYLYYLSYQYFAMQMLKTGQMPPPVVTTKLPSSSTLTINSSSSCSSSSPSPNTTTTTAATSITTTTTTASP
ncbi:unnamed protein product, partial [Rotaria socialis]